MELRLTAELEAKLAEFSAASGRDPAELVEEAMAGYFEEVAQLRGTLDRRYNDLKSGRVKPVDGEAFFEELGKREDELLNGRR